MTAMTAMTALTEVLEFDDVTAGYGATTVLRGVSLHVRPGQICALLGPNGAGKTTLLRTAAGLLRPEKGTVRLNGEAVNKQPPNRRARAGLCLIPEGRGIFRSLTVKDNLRLQLRIGEKNQRAAIDRALDVFPALRDRLGSVAGNLSGGQQQMVALARGYVSEPRVILVDEASMGLAPLVVEEIFQALHALARSGVAMVVVEQYIARALAMADVVVLLHKGSVSYTGPADAVDERMLLHDYLGVQEASAPLEAPIGEDPS
jgi:branched-chain amino acid transport system ATP-binding protein